MSTKRRASRLVRKYVASTESKLIIDLDGVLTDFFRAALTLHGRSDFPHQDIIWNFNEQLGIPDDEFYAPMGYDFWANMPWTPEGQEFLAEITKGINPANICVSTACVLTPGCRDGKAAWVERNLPDFFLHGRFHIGAAKDFFASPATVLVDDNDKNLAAFEKRGGRTVRVPRPWNKSKRHPFLPKVLAQKVIAEYFRV